MSRYANPETGSNAPARIAHVPPNFARRRSAAGLVPDRSATSAGLGTPESLTSCYPCPNYRCITPRRSVASGAESPRLSWSIHLAPLVNCIGSLCEPSTGHVTTTKVDARRLRFAGASAGSAAAIRGASSPRSKKRTRRRVRAASPARHSPRRSVTKWWKHEPATCAGHLFRPSRGGEGRVTRLSFPTAATARAAEAT